MSWSVSASGTPSEVKLALKAQFSYPLADSSGMDEGEKETVRKTADLIDQCLGTFGPTRTVSVSAYGHMGFEDWDSKSGPYQNVVINIA